MHAATAASSKAGEQAACCQPAELELCGASEGRDVTAGVTVDHRCPTHARVTVDGLQPSTIAAAPLDKLTVTVRDAENKRRMCVVQSKLSIAVPSRTGPLTRV